MLGYVLNKRKFHSEKKQKDYCVVSFLRPLNETDRNVEGSFICEDIFLPESLFIVFNALQPFDEVDFIFSISQGRANLVDIKPTGNIFDNYFK